MKSVFTLIFFLVAPNVGMAETVRIQSGNHEKFARLVFYGSNFSNWSISQTQGGYEFSAGDPEVKFDYTSVFNFIPRDRLLDLEVLQNGNLFLPIDCDCYVETFQIRQGLVLDIHDGSKDSILSPESPQRKFSGENRERTKDILETVLSNGSHSGPVFFELDQRNDVSRSSLLWADQIALGWMLAEPEIEISREATDRSVVISDADLVLDRVSALEKDLIEQIGRASVQGFVSPEGPDIRLASEFNPNVEVKTVEDRLVENPDINGPELSPLGSDHVRFETALDRAKPNPTPIPSTTESGELCFPDHWFDVVNWKGEKSDELGLFVGRTSIVGEFDEIDLLALSELTKRYIYLTFGAEAKATMAAFGEKIENHEVLLAVADIMDTGQSDSMALPLSQTECKSRVAFWAILANSDLEQSINISRESVLKTFMELPLHLRKHLGPYLATRFLKIDDEETATEISNIISRAEGKPSPAQVIVDAEINLRSGSKSKGVKGLERVFRDNGPLAADAAVRLVDESIDNNVPLPNEITLATAALARETKGSPIGSELLRVNLRAEANDGGILQALIAMKNHSSDGSLQKEDIHELNREILVLAVENSSDSEFVQAVSFSQMNVGDSVNSNELRRKIAKRLLRINLPMSAREILSDADLVFSDLDRLLIAETFLKEGDAAKVLEVLSGIDTTDALVLKAKAQEDLGLISEALQTYRKVGNSTAEAELEWELGNLDFASENEDGPKKTISDLILESSKQDENSPVNISNSNLNLSDSANLRAAVSELISEFAVE